MKTKSVIVIIISAAFMFFQGFQCSSTELTSAKLYIQQKNLDKAYESLLKEVEKNPQSDEGWYLLGYVYGEKEAYEKMLDCYDKSLKVSNTYKQNILDQRKYHWANLFNKGVAFFQRAVATENKDSANLLFEKSIYNFSKGILCEPDSADTYRNLAFVYLNLQDYNSAIPNLQKVISLEKSVEAYRFLGEIYVSQAENKMNSYKSNKEAKDSLEAVALYDKAINVLEEGRKYFPNDSEILLVLSNTYVQANKIDVAIDAFKAGVDAEPNNKYYRYNYGVLLLGANQFEAAEKQFSKALEIDSEYKNANYNLAITYVKWASLIAKEAEEKGIDDPKVKELYSKAVPYLTKFLDMQPDDANSWELLGKVYSILGNIEKAMECFDKADSLR